METVREWFPEEIANQILHQPLPNEYLHDSWVWTLDGKGNYTVRSGYKALLNLSQEYDLVGDVEMRKYWKKLWALVLPLKVLIFFFFGKLAEMFFRLSYGCWINELIAIRSAQCAGTVMNQ